MIDLLQRYSISDILTFTIFLALAIKSLITFFDWLLEHIKQAFNKEYSKLNKEQKLQDRLQKNDQIMKNLSANQQQNDKILQDLSAKIDMLIDSDKDAIKSYITREHHYFCYQVGWIDDFSLDCLERRYQHYYDEGGNSFIQGFMEQLRALPKQEPETQILREHH